jgi:acyl carrier protein
MNSVKLLSLLFKRPAVPRFVTLPSRQIFSLPARRFSSQQQLNENEVIELVEGKVFEVLKSAAKCNHAKLARTATFEELGFDSLDGVELVLAMEEHFGFDLSNQDAEKITSVMDAIQIFHSYFTKRMQPAETPQ